MWVLRLPGLVKTVFLYSIHFFHWGGRRVFNSYCEDLQRSDSRRVLALRKMPGRVTLRKKQGLWIMAHEGTSFLLHLVMSSPVGFTAVFIKTRKLISEIMISHRSMRPLTWLWICGGALVELALELKLMYKVSTCIRCYILWMVIRYSRKTKRNLVDKWPNKGNKCSNLQDQISSSKGHKLQIFLTRNMYNNSFIPSPNF